MTEKQKIILDYLANHNGQAYYIDIRDGMDMMLFEDEDDFYNAIHGLVKSNLIYENEYGDTLYKLAKKVI